MQRLLTAEGRVDSQRMRKGTLQPDDFTRLARAAGILNAAPIWIDDTPGITLLEIRSKARRLKAATWRFGHGLRHRLPDGLLLADSYHCSRYNTQTGRLTSAMFEAVVAGLRQELS